MRINGVQQSFKGDGAVSSVVEHFLDTQGNSERSAPVIDAFSRIHPVRSDILPNKMSNSGRFRRIERGLHRHVRNGELWFVGRQGGKVVWRRLRTHDLQVARATVAMFESTTNGNTAVFLVVDGKEQPVPEATPVVRDEPLPRVRQVMVAAESPAAPARGCPPLNPHPPAPPPPSMNSSTGGAAARPG
jgi:hypothetical protein